MKRVFCANAQKTGRLDEDKRFFHTKMSLKQPHSGAPPAGTTDVMPEC